MPADQCEEDEAILAAASEDEGEGSSETEENESTPKRARLTGEST